MKVGKTWKTLITCWTSRKNTNDTQLFPSKKQTNKTYKHCKKLDFYCIDYDPSFLNCQETLVGKNVKWKRPRWRRRIGRRKANKGSSKNKVPFWQPNPTSKGSKIRGQQFW